VTQATLSVNVNVRSIAAGVLPAVGGLEVGRWRTLLTGSLS